MDRQHGADAAEGERHGLQPERRLERAGQHPRLAVEEQERQHAHQRRDVAHLDQPYDAADHLPLLPVRALPLLVQLQLRGVFEDDAVES